jgi:hypothetical protein
MVGGLVVSQALTLFTTPLVYLYMEKLPAVLHGFSLKGSSGHAAKENVSTP